MKRTLGLLSFAVLFVVCVTAYWRSFPDREAIAQDWVRPSPDSLEGKMYDYAHSIKLPDSIPKTVPFQFCKEKLFNYCITHASFEQYHEHLCKTEGGEFILKTVKGVEGFRQIRPYPTVEDTALGKRYMLEDPSVGFVGNPLGHSGDLLAQRVVQPPFGKYEFFDAWYFNGKPFELRHFYRDPHADPIGEKAQYYNFLRKTVPWVIASTRIEKSSARYGFVTRGIRRERDREYLIAGTELIVLDLQENEVLGVRRDFQMAGDAQIPPQGSDFNMTWGYGKRCSGRGKTYNPVTFIESVLIPVHADGQQ